MRNELKTVNHIIGVFEIQKQKRTSLMCIFLLFKAMRLPEMQYYIFVPGKQVTFKSGACTMLQAHAQLLPLNQCVLLPYFIVFN